MKTNKKGFTIVELVVVIAVIAILAGVLVPTFSNLIKRAQTSKDEQLVRNMNTALALELEAPKTMQGALDVAASAGYDVEKINASNTDNEILWDSRHNLFCYYDSVNKARIYVPGYEPQAGDEAKDYELWCIADELPTALKWSIYASTKWTATEVPVDGVGFDAGKVNKITSINYINSSAEAKNVVIRTNGGKLTVDAKNDEVAHFGFASELNIKSVKMSSYTENGTIQFAEIAGGNFVLAAGAEVSNIHFDVNTETQKFENADGLKISVDLSKATMTPDFSRDPVEIDATNGTLVAQVKTTEDDYIWLTKSGIIEVVTLSDSATEATTNYAEKTDANYDIADQIANNIERNADGKVKDKDITVAETDYTIHFDEETKEFKTYEKGTTTEATLTPEQKTAVENAIKEEVVEGVPSKEEVLAAATEFGGGKGTKENPWLIYDYETMQKISNHFNDQTPHYFKVAIDKCDKDNNGNPIIDCTRWNSVQLNGSFDGNGVKFINLDAPLFSEVKAMNLSTISNFTADCNIVSQTGRAAICTEGAYNMNFHDITVTGYIEGQGQTAAMISYPGSGITEFKNVNVSADIVSLGDVGAAVFVLNPYALLSSYGGNEYSKLVFDNCHYSGKMSATGVCNFFYVHTISVPVEIKNIDANEYGASVNTYNHRALASQSSKVNKTNIDISAVAAGDTFVFDKLDSSAVTCTVTISISPNGTNETGSFTGVYLRDGNISLGDDGKFHTTNAIKITSASVNDQNKNAGLNDLDSDGKFEHYNIISSAHGTTHNGGFLTVIQYDSRGNVVAYASVGLFDKTNN